MTEVAAFLVQTVIISLSGVMAPGPITAATVAAGTRRPHAGMLVAIGHGLVELPLMLLILLGLGRYLQREPVRIGIGVAGGLFLLLLGIRMLATSRRAAEAEGVDGGRHPVRTGAVLTGANPYFLIWWATIGLALLTEAMTFGIVVLAVFALVHWLCDLVWLEALGWASSRGSRLLGPRTQSVVLGVCGAALVLFACLFLHDAARRAMAS